MKATKKSGAVPQKFVGHNLRAAYSQVREHLGEDAFIVDQIVGNGRVEIWASLEAPETVQKSPVERQEIKPKAERAPARTKEQRVAGQLHYKYWNRLQRMGFDAQTIDGLACKKASKWSEVRDTLVAALPVSPMPLILKEGRFCFVGRTGVGKTSTIIKLAANHVMQYGPQSLAIVTTDSKRLAGSESLLLAGELLGIEVIEASATKTLKSILNGLLGKALVLIDTPGASKTVCMDKELNLQTLVVVPATHQKSVVKAQLEQMENPRVVLTHLDESENIGESLSQIQASNGKVCLVSTGPNIPDDLESASAEILVTIIESHLLKKTDTREEA